MQPIHTSCVPKLMTKIKHAKIYYMKIFAHETFFQSLVHTIEALTREIWYRGVASMCDYQASNYCML